MFDVRDLAEKDLRPFRRGDQDLAEQLRVCAILSGVSHAYRESSTPFDGRRERALADRGFDDLLDVADADAIASCRGAVDLDVQVLAARDLLGIDVARSGHLSDDVSHTA